MKKIILSALAILAIGGSLAIADLILPSQVYFSGDAAKNVNAKIAEVTGQKPSNFMGKKVLSANAQVFCSEYSDGQVGCTIDIQK